VVVVSRSVPRPLPAASQTVACGHATLPQQEKRNSADEAAVVCHRYLAVVPRPLPAAPFLVCRRYLVVTPRPLPAAPLAVRRTYLAVVPRPVLRPLPAATRRCRIKRRALGR
jgi:hypothetical protein